MNGWNLQITPFWKENDLNPNLQGIMLHVNLGEVYDLHDLIIDLKSCLCTDLV